METYDTLKLGSKSRQLKFPLEKYVPQVAYLEREVP